MTAQLPDRAQAILRGEDGGYSPWASVCTVAMSAMNVGWTEQQFIEAVVASDLADVFATENGRDRYDRLRQRLAKAWSRAESAWTPPLGDRNDVRQRLEALSQRLAEHRWTGRTASKDRAVALALVAWAHEIGVWTIDAGKRELGLRAGVGQDTAARALRRLAGVGLVSKDEAPRQSNHSQRWLLNLDWGISGQTEPHDLVLRGERFMWLNTTTNSPVFVGGALGQTAERVWLDLAEHPEATAAEVAERTGVSLQTIRKRAMPKLIEHGLIEQGTRPATGRGRPALTYRLSPNAPSLDDVAERLGVLDWHERTAERHERERAGYREVQRQKAERTKQCNANWSREMAAEIDALMHPDPFASPPPAWVLEAVTREERAARQLESATAAAVPGPWD